MRLSENLRYLMRTRKVSGEEFGKALGKSKSAISTYVNGAVSPTIDDLLIIRNMFQIDLESLFFKDLSQEDTESSDIFLPKRDKIIDNLQYQLSELTIRLSHIEKKLLPQQ